MTAYLKAASAYFPDYSLFFCGQYGSIENQLMPYIKLGLKDVMFLSVARR